MNLSYIKNNFEVIVIPCSSKKVNFAAKAEDFYVGKGYFLHQLRVAKASGLPWFILSTKYGLISPNFICQPYSLIWSKKVLYGHHNSMCRETPIASEEQRQTCASAAIKALSGEKVLTFCSMHYMPYFPNWTFFNYEVGKSGGHMKTTGIQFLIHKMYQIYLESLNAEN